MSEQERDADVELHRACTTDGKPFTAGFEDLLGQLLAFDHQPQEWHKASEAYRPRVAAILQRFENLDLEDAHRKAATICTYAQMRAQEHLDLKYAKLATAEKIVPDQDTQAPRQTNPPQGRPVKVEHFRDAAAHVMREATKPEPAISTPFPGLNHLLNGGMRAGELILLASRPGIGKSAMAVEMATWSAEHSHPALIVSREMTNAAQARRMIAQQGKINASGLRSGHGVDWQKVTDTIGKMYDYPIWLTEDATSVERIDNAIGQLPKCHVLVVDYLQLLDGPRGLRDARARVESVSRDLKSLAMTRKIPILALCSVTRPQGKDEKIRPTLSSLRESGNLEHDANVVLILHRHPITTEDTECHIDKGRDGGAGACVHLRFRKEFVLFDELTRDDPDFFVDRYGS